MNGIAIVTAGAAPAVGARRGHTRGRAKPARASGTPSDVLPRPHRDETPSRLGP
jgi:hypothetical protein